jgi:hypothetical protein
VGVGFFLIYPIQNALTGRPGGRAWILRPSSRCPCLSANWFNMADIDRTSESLFIDGAFVRLAFSR